MPSEWVSIVRNLISAIKVLKEGADENVLLELQIIYELLQIMMEEKIAPDAQSISLLQYHATNCLSKY
jgi:hypothetical protein